MGIDCRLDLGRGSERVRGGLRAGLPGWLVGPPVGTASADKICPLENVPNEPCGNTATALGPAKLARRNFDLCPIGPELAPGWRIVDSTHVKVHADGSNPAGGQSSQAMGRTK